MLQEKDPDKTLASVCGLYCGACSVYIGTTEDPARLKRHAAQYGLTAEETSCLGCRSAKIPKIRTDCKFPSCAAAHGVEFCGECPEYPCSELQAFKAECPHRNDIFRDLEQINRIGVTEWLRQARTHYTCSACGTVNSPYDLKCRECAKAPASEFCKQNKREIKGFLKNNRIL